jgi:hypothetical protein
MCYECVECKTFFYYNNKSFCFRSSIQAVNGPLQQRTTVLDKDLSRAITLPDDYDTDLESEWSNPSKIVTKFNESLDNLYRFIC